VSVMVIIEPDGVTVEQYEQVNETMGVSSVADVPGLISHAAGQADGGLLIVDVWESAEAFESFVEERLGAALAQAGVSGRPEPRVLPVHNHIPNGAGTQAGVLMIIESDGFDTDTYDQLTANMDAHQGDGSNHPSVSHVAAVTDSGMVFVDMWGSPEEFAAFAESQIEPAAGDEGLPPFEPKFVPVYNHMR
jgi:heme-degrading monooxygenase HmoA